MPFPWSRNEPVSKASADPAKLGCTGVSLHCPGPYTKFARQIDCKKPLGGPASATMTTISHEECVAFDLPKTGASAGSVLRHSQNVFGKLKAKHEPMIYKFGFTHNPMWRWKNPMYGYAKARDGWTNMVVLYVSHEHYSPAMLEAALIDKHIGFSKEHDGNIF